MEWWRSKKGYNIGDVEKVDRFCYLRDTISSGGGCEIAELYGITSSLPSMPPLPPKNMNTLKPGP